MNKIIFFITAYRNFLIKKKKIQKTFKTSKINKYKLIAAYDKFWEDYETIPLVKKFFFHKAKEKLFKHYQFFKFYNELDTYVLITLSYKYFFFYLDLIFAVENTWVIDRIYKNALQKPVFYSFLFKYLYIYNVFFIANFIRFFYIFSTKDQKNFYFSSLIWSFKNKNLFINLMNIFKINFLGLSTGLFIKFYEKKKSLKKTKTIKFLLIRFLRKILLISKINNLIFKIKKKPIYFLELLNLLNQRIIHKFLNPCENKFIDETVKPKINPFRFIFFIFLKNISYSKLKLKKKGRIKRKILRKIILNNKLID